MTKLYKNVYVLATSLYFFYHNSGLNRAMLMCSHKAMETEGQGHLLLPTRVGDTRWIGHTMRALVNLTGSYKYIVQHFGQVNIHLNPFINTIWDMTQFKDMDHKKMYRLCRKLALIVNFLYNLYICAWI